MSSTKSGSLLVGLAVLNPYEEILDCLWMDMREPTDIDMLTTFGQYLCNFLGPFISIVLSTMSPPKIFSMFARKKLSKWLFFMQRVGRLVRSSYSHGDQQHITAEIRDSIDAMFSVTGGMWLYYVHPL